MEEKDKREAFHSTITEACIGEGWGRDQYAMSQEVNREISHIPLTIFRDIAIIIF